MKGSSLLFVHQVSCKHHLIGGFNPSEKNTSQIGKLPQVGMNIQKALANFPPSHGLQIDTGGSTLHAHTGICKGDRIYSRLTLKFNQHFEKGLRILDVLEKRKNRKGERCKEKDEIFETFESLWLAK